MYFFIFDELFKTLGVRTLTLTSFFFTKHKPLLLFFFVIHSCIFCFSENVKWLKYPFTQLPLAKLRLKNLFSKIVRDQVVCVCVNNTLPWPHIVYC